MFGSVIGAPICILNDITSLGSSEELIKGVVPAAYYPNADINKQKIIFFFAENSF
jgi:hypothetical protein